MTQTPTMAPNTAWATGLVFCTSGLPKATRNSVASTVFGAGGRYTPNLSSHVTHVIVDGESSSDTEKLRQMRLNRETWPQEVVDIAWLAECVREQRLVDVEGYLVLPSAQVSNISQGVPAVDTAASQMSCNVSHATLISAQRTMDHHVPSPSELQNSQMGESNSIPTVRPDLLPDPHIVLPHSTTKPWTISMSQLPEDPLLFRASNACTTSSCDPVVPWRIALPTLTEDMGEVQVAGAPDALPQPLLTQPGSPELPTSPAVCRQPIAWALSPALLPIQAPVPTQLPEQPLNMPPAGRSAGLQERLPTSDVCLAPHSQDNGQLMTSGRGAQPASMSLRSLLARPSQVHAQQKAALLQAASMPLPSSQDVPLDSPELLNEPVSYCKHTAPTAPTTAPAWQLHSAEGDHGGQLRSQPILACNAPTISNTDQHDRGHPLGHHASHIASLLDSHQQQNMHPRLQPQSSPPQQQHLSSDEIGAVYQPTGVGAFRPSCLPHNTDVILTPLPSSQQQATGFLPVNTLLQQLQLASSRAEAAEHQTTLQDQPEHAFLLPQPHQQQPLMVQEAAVSHTVETSMQFANSRLHHAWNINAANAQTTEQPDGVLSPPQPLSSILSHGRHHYQDQGTETNQKGGHAMQQAGTSSQRQHSTHSSPHVLGEITNVKPPSPGAHDTRNKSSPAKQTLMSTHQRNSGGLSGLQAATSQEATVVVVDSAAELQGMLSGVKQTLSAKSSEPPTQLPVVSNAGRSMHGTPQEQRDLGAHLAIGCQHVGYNQGGGITPHGVVSAVRCQQPFSEWTGHSAGTASQQQQQQQQPLSPSNRQHASKLCDFNGKGYSQHRFREVANKNLSGLGLQAAVLDILATQRTDNNSIHCVDECGEQTQIQGTALSYKQQLPSGHRPSSPVTCNQQHPVPEQRVPYAILREQGIPPINSQNARPQADAATQTDNCSYELGDLLQHIAKSAYLDPDLSPNQASAAMQSWPMLVESTFASGRNLATLPLCQQGPANAQRDEDIPSASIVVCEPSSAMKWWDRGHHVISPQWIHDARQATASSGAQLQFMSSGIAEHIRKHFTSLQSSSMQIDSEVVCLSASENAISNSKTSSFDTNKQPEQQQHGRKAVRFVTEIEQCEKDVTTGQAQGQPKAAAEPLSSIKERQRVLQEIKKQEAAKAAGLARSLKTGIKMYIAPIELLSDVDWTVTSEPQLAEFYSQDADSCRTHSDPSTEVVFKGPSMILLAPRDAAGLLGHDAVQLHGGSQGITAQAVLEAVHTHYAQPMTREDMVHIMTQSADFRRLLQEPFLRGHDVPLSTLLKDRVGWEGLKRYGRDHTMPVYQLDLC